MNQIIAANSLELWIGEKSKSVSGFLQHVLAIDLRTINTDRNRTDSRIRKRFQIVFDTPQLGVTYWSPIAPVKNQQHTFRRLVVNWLSQQLRQRYRLVVRISESEIGRLVSDLRRSSRCRQPPSGDEDAKKKTCQK